MSLPLASWVASVLGHAVDVDGAWGAQCVDLANDWAQHGLGLPTFLGPAAASMVPAKPGSWSWRANSPDNYPEPGRVVVWDPNLAAAIGVSGHCAVVLTADVRHLVTVDQNWRGLRVATVFVHDYAGVAGWWLPTR